MRTKKGSVLAAAAVAIVLSTLVGAASVAARSTVAPANVQEPVITGTPVEENVLGATTGTWTGTPPITYTYQWVRCGQDGGNSDGSNCATIGGATMAFYQLTGSDVGSRLRVKVTATNVDGAATAASNPTAVVQPKGPVGTKPNNTKEPGLTGTPVEGNVLGTSAGSWSGTTPMTFAYQWVRCGQDGGNSDGSNCGTIGGATMAFYQLRSSDVGSRLRARVTATNSAGSTTAASDPTAVVKAKAPAAVKPSNTKEPTIAGTPVEGNSLNASTGTWNGTAPITYSYQWVRCDQSGGNPTGSNCATIGGATRATYQLAGADVGRRLRVRVTAMNAAGSATAASDPTATVQQRQPSEIIQLPTGEKSIPASGVTKGERLVVSKVVFSPNPVTTRDRPIQVRIRVKDTRGYVVRGAVVFIRSTPRLTTGGDQQVTQVDGWVTYNLVPFDTFPLKRGYNVQFFVKAYRVGDPTLAGISNRRLVQIATLG